MLKAIRFVLLRLLLITGGLFVALVAIEILLRVFPVPTRFEFNRQETEQWESDPELLLHLKPNLNLRISAHPEFSYTVRTNSEGLRNDPLEGSYDVAAIGDSFTFGFGVEAAEAWPAQLQTLSGVKVLNLGWAGWNSYVYPATIRRYAIPLQTKLWLWAFFVNDLPESAGAEAFISSGKTDYLAQYEAQNQTSPLLSLRSLEVLAALFNPELFVLPDSGSTVYDDGQLKMRLSDYAWRMSDPADAEVQRGWALTEAALLKAQLLATANGARLIVVFIPAREHVYWAEVGAHLPDLEVAQLDSVATHLEQFTAAHEIGFLDLLPGFRAEAEQGHMLYFAADGHWNQAGHQLAARLIDDYLSQQGLLPDS